MEIPSELKSVLEIVEEGGVKHIKCKYRTRSGSECGALFFSLVDAIRHLITHDERFRRYLKLIEKER